MPRRLAHALVAAGVLATLVAGLAGASPARAADSWSWPLAGQPQVDRPFQPPASSYGAGHRGVDLRGEPGEPVLAAGAGTVTYAGLLAGRGVVTVTHAGGLRTTYEPVDASVRRGEHVDAGDVLGTLGTGHASCRAGVACLHWGLLRGRTYLDPLGLVAGGSLQLLPIDAKPPHHKSKLRQKIEDKIKQKIEEQAKSKLGRLRSKVGKLVAQARNSIGRAGSAVKQVAEQVVKKVGPQLARVAARAAERALVSAAAEALAAAAPVIVVVAAVVLVVVVVAGVVYYVEYRS